MSSEHTHVLSMQNASWPAEHCSWLQSEFISHDFDALLQLHAGIVDDSATTPTHMPAVARRRRATIVRRRRRRSTSAPTSRNSPMPPAPGPPLLHVQPT